MSAETLRRAATAIIEPVLSAADAVFAAWCVASARTTAPPRRSLAAPVLDAVRRWVR